MLENNTVNLETAVSPTTLEFKRADQHDTEENVFKKKKKRKGQEDLPESVAVFIEHHSKTIIR